MFRIALRTEDEFLRQLVSSFSALSYYFVVHKLQLVDYRIYLFIVFFIEMLLVC